MEYIAFEIFFVFAEEMKPHWFVSVGYWALLTKPNTFVFFFLLLGSGRHWRRPWHVQPWSRPCALPMSHLPSTGGWLGVKWAHYPLPQSWAHPAPRASRKPRGLRPGWRGCRGWPAGEGWQVCPLTHPGNHTEPADDGSGARRRRHTVQGYLQDGHPGRSDEWGHSIRAHNPQSKVARLIW